MLRLWLAENNTCSWIHLKVIPVLPLMAAESCYFSSSLRCFYISNTLNWSSSCHPNDRPYTCDPKPTRVHDNNKRDHCYKNKERTKKKREKFEEFLESHCERKGVQLDTQTQF